VVVELHCGHLHQVPEILSVANAGWLLVVIRQSQHASNGQLAGNRSQLVYFERGVSISRMGKRQIRVSGIYSSSLNMYQYTHQTNFSLQNKTKQKRVQN